MTIKTNVKAARKALEENKDGLSINELSEITGIEVCPLHNAVKCIPEAYVDRWAPNKAGTQWVMVYCLWEKPPVPPKPAVKAAVYARAAHA